MPRRSLSLVLSRARPAQQTRPVSRSIRCRGPASTIPLIDLGRLAAISTVTLLRINLELIAPLIANRPSLARVFSPQSSALTMRFMSLRITTPSFAPSPTPTPDFDDLRRTGAISHVVQLVQNVIQLLPSIGRTMAVLRDLLR